MAVSVPPDAAGKVPPQNQEAEVSVLGAIMLSEQALDALQIDIKLHAEDFYRERHRLIFGAMIRLKDRTEPVDALTVTEELGRTGVLEEVGGSAYVHLLPTQVPSAANVSQYARIVKEHALLRRLLHTTTSIQEDVYGHRGDSKQILEQAEGSIYRIAHDEHRGELRSIEAVLDDEIEKLEKLSREGVSLTGTPSGFKGLDEMTGGFQPGNLVVLAARPSMGKSCLVTNIAENTSVKYGKAVALFSLEMSETELAQRFLASKAKISGDDLRKGRVRGETWNKVRHASDLLAPAPLYVDDSSDLSILELRAKTRRLHSRQPLGLVIVDYLQLMRPEETSISRVEQIGQISRGLKLLAGELGIPVIGVSQLSRAVEQRPEKIPMLSDLRESGQIEQDADLVLFIYRDEYYKKEESERPGEADIIIAKHRNGPVGEVVLSFQPRYPRFYDLSRRTPDDRALSRSDGPAELEAGAL